MLHERFRAMGTSMELLLDAPESPSARAALAAARREIERLEGLLSRFRPDSELSLLNRERRMRIGPDLGRVLATGLRLRRITGGRFDPTVGRAVVAAGYDRSFDLIEDEPRPAAAPVPSGGGVVVLDDEWGWAALGPGVDLDLGAIAKGDAADRACAVLSEAGSCLVNAGGDLVASGPRAEGAWPVGLDCADGGIVLDLESGALATSGTDRRGWVRGGRRMHHAIDPPRGTCAETDLVRATAIAATGAEADALATALLVAGAREARHLAEAWQVPAALVDESGGLTLVGGLR